MKEKPPIRFPVLIRPDDPHRHPFPIMTFTDTRPDWARRGEYLWSLQHPKPKGKPNPLP